jgi:hypothetical protein
LARGTTPSGGTASCFLTRDFPREVIKTRIFSTESCVKRFELRADAILPAETVARLTHAWILLSLSRVAIALWAFFALAPVLPVFHHFGRPSSPLLSAWIWTALLYALVPPILARITRAA